MNKRGFTLTELLAVIAIIAILSVAAISGYGTMTANSKKKTLETKIKSIEHQPILNGPINYTFKIPNREKDNNI